MNSGFKSLNRKNFILGAVIFGTILLSSIAFYTIHDYLFYISTDNAQIEGHIYPILPRVGGYVSEILVKDNEKVSKGQILLKIDPADLKAQVAKAKASLETAKANLSMMQAKAESLKAQSSKSGRDFIRFTPLANKKEISEQQFDQIKVSSKTASEEWNAALKQVIASEAEVNKAKAELEYHELQLSYATILAPADGKVTQKNVEIGQLVQPAQSLMNVVENESLWVVANFKETQVAHIQPGQKVNIKTDIYPKKTFQGHVDSIQAGTGAVFSLLPPENATGNFVKVVQRIPVKIVFDEPMEDRYRLAPGMSVIPEVKIR